VPYGVVYPARTKTPKPTTTGTMKAASSLHRSRPEVRSATMARAPATAGRRWGRTRTASAPRSDPPARHRYGWAGGARFPFSLLVRSGTGNWEFTEVEGGTQIVWSYTFGLTSPLAYPLALPIVRLFRGWLQQGLDAVQAEILARSD